MTVRHDRPAPGAHLHQKAWERSLGGPPEARSISPPPPPPPEVPRSVLNLARRPLIGADCGQIEGRRGKLRTDIEGRRCNKDKDKGHIGDRLRTD